MTEPDQHAARRALTAERWTLREHLSELLRGPMVVLSFVWLGLIVLGFTRGLSHRLSALSYAIWGLFALDFLLEWTVAPHKRRYLRLHWLTVVSLLLPALGVFRMVPVLRLLLTAHAGGYVSLLRIVTSLNRGMGALRRTMRNRGIGYLIALTGVIILVGAAGMLSFESPKAIHQAGFPNGAAPGDGLHGYADAL